MDFNLTLSLREILALKFKLYALGHYFINLVPTWNNFVGTKMLYMEGLIVFLVFKAIVKGSLLFKSKMFTSGIYDLPFSLK